VLRFLLNSSLCSPYDLHNLLPRLLGLAEQLGGTIALTTDPFCAMDERLQVGVLDKGVKDRHGQLGGAKRLCMLGGARGRRERLCVR
jgi:hypothetical protein